MDQETIDKISFRHISWDDVENQCYSIYSQMLEKQYKPDAIVGLLRGGVVPARIFSDLFGILLDFFALDVKLYDGIDIRKENPVIGPFDREIIRGRSVLIVDDILDSGRTMKAVLECLRGEKVTTATLFWKETAKEKPDYYAEIAKHNEWIVFPFEKQEFGREMSQLPTNEFVGLSSLRH